MGEFLASITGLGFGLGLTTIAVGLRGMNRPSRALSTWGRLRDWRPAARHGAAVFVGAAVWLVTGWPVAGVALAAAVGFLPWLTSAGKTSARRIGRLEALETWLRRVSDLIGSGHLGLLSAIKESARDAPPAIADEIGTLAQRLRIWEFRSAMLTFADEIDDRVGDVAAAGLCVVHQNGSGAADLLSALARQVAAEVAGRRAAEVERARRRSTARVLLIIWALMFVGFGLVGASAYTAVYRSVFGQIVLAIVLTLVAAAVVWLRRLGDEPPSLRFLRARPEAR
ncbi:type II secretion system F family protein [Amycolatopsis sp. NPDC047767]|uniref:type II secretion system F family protein n=1 Tax=Amycolatopsis sp. NPDC047767 TaxID=3156765 RepID=UPI003455CA08